MRCSVVAVISALVLCRGVHGDQYSAGYDTGYDDGYTSYTDYEPSPPRAYSSHQPSHKPSHKPHQSYETYKPSYEPSYQSYQPYCDCSKYELLGFGSGVASLATFGTLLLLAQVNGTGSSLLTGRDVADEDGSVARAAVSVACRGVQLIHGEASWADIGRDLVVASLRSGGDRVPQDLLRRGARLVHDWRVLADRGGVSGRSGGGSCDCFPGLAGAVTGFAALGGIAGYSLYQANRALRAALTLAAMTTTTTTTTGRQLDFGSLATPLDDVITSPDLLEKLDMLSHMADLLLGTSQQSCQQYELCQLSRRAAAAGPPYSDLVTLASLPLSSLMATRSGNSESALCWAVSSSGSRRSCSQLYPACGHLRRLSRQRRSLNTESRNLAAKLAGIFQ